MEDLVQKRVDYICNTIRDNAKAVDDFVMGVHLFMKLLPDDLGLVINAAKQDLAHKAKVYFSSGGDSIDTTDYDRRLELEALCKDLLNGAVMCSEAPEYMVQPWLKIIKDHADIIAKHNLMEDSDGCVSKV